MATIKSITSHDMNGETELSKFLLAKQYLFQEHGHDVSEITNATTKDEHEELKKEHDTLRTEHDTLRSEHDTLKGSHDTLRDDHDDLALKHEDLDARHYKLLNDFNEVKKKVLILQKYIMTQLDSTREMLTKIDKDDENEKKNEDDKKNEEKTNETTHSSESQSSSI